MSASLLPTWPVRTVAVLATLGDGPHSIPVSAPLRAGDDEVLLSLRSDRGSLARLRADPRVALTVLSAGDVAFTARGRARIIAEPMAADGDYAAVAITVEAVDDHRQAAFTVAAGIDRRWIDSGARDALGARLEELERLSRPAAATAARTTGTPRA